MSRSCARAARGGEGWRAARGGAQAGISSTQQILRMVEEFSANVGANVGSSSTVRIKQGCDRASKSGI